MASELHVDAIKHSGGTSAMTIDSSGRVFTPVRPAFFAYATSSPYISSAATDQKLGLTEDYDKTNNFANSEFTCPVSGLYFFNVSVNFYGSGVSTRYVRARLYKNGSTTQIECHSHMSDETGNSDYAHTSFGCTLDLSANDVMAVYVTSSSTSIQVAGFNKTTHFSGHLIG
tara:strand:- start:678 stop:1190 length:513 start_codon:yes stop_codon:yes gene_type:complete